MSDDWILDLSDDGGIELTKHGGSSGSTDFPPIIIIRGWHGLEDGASLDLANRFFLQSSENGASPGHYIFGGADTDLPSSAVGGAVTARLTGFIPESGSFRATLDDVRGL